jgi:acyl-CoA hydrolase
MLWDSLMVSLKNGKTSGVPIKATYHERLALMYPQSQNRSGNIFGGYLMRLAYEDAWNAAFLHSGKRPILASVDRINFVRPVRIGELIRVRTRISYVGNSSMGIETVLSCVEPMTRAEAITNSCYFTMVAVDENRKPVVVPKVYPETYDEFYQVERSGTDSRARLQSGYLWGYRRYQANAARRKELIKSSPSQCSKACVTLPVQESK